ncbi:Lrp/AsnC family transcriptional regulator [Flagellimonas onchidii]|uniref:Lrp/AsnC family transcriptional regulator n=1 Tax=Flagellimonas onchidii TaxID=2562684 RepID=UPI0010A66FFA|nr:Lrp/AsnC family transcriptional regulator [Allomuricauda onchidii]
MRLDEMNWAILAELQKNGRMPVKEIAKNVGLSSPAVSERIQKLEDWGIIKGYTAKINIGALGYPLGVNISIKLRYGQTQNFIEFVKTVPEIFECHQLTGNDCMQMKGYVKNPDHLQNLNSRLAAYGEMTTSLVLSTVITNKVLEKDMPFPG